MSSMLLNFCFGGHYRQVHCSVCDRIVHTYVRSSVGYQL